LTGSNISKCPSGASSTAGEPIAGVELSTRAIEKVPIKAAAMRDWRVEGMR